VSWMNEGKDLTFSANSCSTISAIFAIGWFPTLTIVLRGIPLLYTFGFACNLPN
jgi:hypothetical protein